MTFKPGITKKKKNLSTPAARGATLTATVSLNNHNTPAALIFPEFKNGKRNLSAVSRATKRRLAAKCGNHNRNSSLQSEATNEKQQPYL